MTTFDLRGIDDLPAAPAAPASAPSKYDLSAIDELPAADGFDKSASLFAATFGNPSEEAEKRRLSSDIERITGNFTPVLDIKEATRQHKQLQADHVTRASPRTSEFLSVRENAAVAIDDAKTMAQIEAIVGGDPARALEITAKRLAMAPANLGAWGFDVAGVVPDIAGEGLAAVGLPNEYNVFRDMASGSRRHATAARAAVDYFTPEARNMVERAAASAGTSAGTSLQLLPLAMTGAGAPMAAAFGLGTFGESYTKAREQGKNPIQALQYAIPQGAYEALFEMAPAAFLADALKTAPGLKQFVAGLAAREVPTEMATTVAQNLNDWVTFNPNKSVADFIAEQPEALAETIIATVMGAGVQAGIIHGAQRTTGQFQQMQEERRAKQLQETLTGLMDQAKQIKSDPVTFQNFMAGVTDNATVFVNADALQDTLAQNKMDVSVLPSLAEQLAQPSVTGDVEVPIGELMTAFAGTPAQEQIVQHARVRQDDLSAAEQAKFGDMGTFFKQQGEAVMEKQKANEAFVTERQEIEADIVKQLGAASPFQEREHRYYAQMMGAFYSTAADLMGTTPKQIQARWAPKISGPNGAATAGSTLTQGFDHGQAMLNVGLDVGATDRAQKIDAAFVEAELNKMGVRVLSGENVDGEYELNGQMVQELTYVPHLSRPLTEAEVNQLAVATGQEAIPQYVGGVGNLWGPNAAAWGDFNPEFFKDQRGTKLSDAQKELAQSQSARRPTAKRAPEDHLGEVPLSVDYTKIEPEKTEQNTKLVSQYPGIRFKARKAEGRAEEFIQHVTNNLLWLHDQIPAEIRQRSKLWYDGARAITDRWSAKYGKTDAQIAAILAVYSPQKDWFMNVSLAERTLDIVANQQDTAWSPEMTEVADKILADEKFSMLRGAIEGKKLSELKDRLEQAAWLRTFDEAHNNRGHRLVTPEGGFIEFATSVKGAEKKTGWPGFGTIIKALYVIDDGSPKMIDNALGGEHKVRSFYNNIFHPTSNLGFVTIDTHAVAAGLLRPLSGNSVEVAHNFGGAGTATSAATGMSGTYAYYQEAYRRAAEARGLLPREMQSITWAAVRELYTMGFKHDTAKMAVVDKLWSEYEKGKRDLDSVRAGILNLAGGVEQPSWVDRDSGISPEGWASTYTGELLGGSVPRRDTGVEPGAGDRAAAGVSGSELAQLNRSAGAVAGPVVGIHFSKAPRTSLSSGMFGTGMPGAERDRVIAGNDPRIKQRVAFYVNTGNGIKPEDGVGSHAHTATLRNLYDADADALKIWKNAKDDMNQAESAVLDAGFDGYLTRGFGKQGAVVMLGKRSIEATGIKAADVSAVAEKPPSPEIPKMKLAAMAIMQNRALPNGQQSVASWKRDLERSDPETAALIAWDKIKPGDYYKDQIAGQLWQTTFKPVDTGSAEFKAWSRDAEIVARDDTFSRDFESDKPVVVQVLHGTTGNFTSFDRDRANPESDMGAGFYATNDEMDSSENYAGEGPDLTIKLDTLADRVQDEDEFADDRIAAEAEARRRLAVQNQGFAMPVWMRFEKPFVLGGANETQLTYEVPFDEETDEYGEESGTLVDFIVELRNVAEQYDEGAVEELVDALLTAATDSENVSATTLFEAVGEAEGFAYYTDSEGVLVSKEIFRQTLENLGYDGIIDQTVDAKFGSSKKRGQPMRGVNPDTKHFIVFSPEQIKSAISNTGEFSDTNPSILFAESAGPRRGSFNPLTFDLRLLADANRSTFIHEASHFFMAAYIDMASHPDAPPALTEFVEGLLGYLFDKVEGSVGATGTNLERWNAMTLDQQRAYWEFFAEGWEQYAMSGKAPTKALQSAFNAFAKWMKEIYKTLKNFVTMHGTKPLDAELTQYFDRMLATDEELEAARAERGFQALFKNLAESGMAPAQFADYMALDSLQKTEAEELLRSRSIRDMKWLSNAKSRAIKEIQAEADELRNLVRASVEEELANTPIRQAERWLRKGEMAQDGEQIKATAGHRLDIDIVKAMFPEGAIAGQLDFAKLGRGKNALASSTGTQHPDDVAKIFGFRSGEQLVRELVEMPAFKDEVAHLTDLRMLEEHGDLATPQAIEKAADEAIHNDAHLKMVATEVWALTNRTGSVAMLTKAAKAFAANLIDNTVVKKLSPVQYVNAATRAGKAAVRAMAKKDTDKAASEKRVEMVNAAAAKEAYAAEAEVRAIMTRLRKIAAYSDKHSSITSREFGVVQAVRAILAEFSIGTHGEKATKYLKTLSDYDPTLGAVLDDVIEQLAPESKPWPELKVADLRELHAAVTGLWRVAKEVRSVELAGEKMSLDDARAQLIAKLEETGAKDRQSKAFSLTDAEIRNQDFQSYAAKAIRPENWVSMKDGLDEYGPWRRLIWNTIDRAQLDYNADKGEKLKQLKALLVPIMADMTDIKIDAPELGGAFGAGSVIGYSELLHAILHTGNTSNKTKLLVGRGWGSLREDGSVDSSKWDAFMARMWAEGKITKTHMDFVQGVWDLLESMKEGAQKAHRETTGRYFEEIEAAEIVTPFGVYRGGYAPAIVDRRQVADMDIRKLQEAAEMDVVHSFDKPAGGFTKSRVQNYNQKLELNIAALGRHIDQVLLFSHMSGPVRNVQRVLKGKDLSNALAEADRAAMAHVLAPWLHSAATQTVTEKGKLSYENMALFTKLRSRAGMALMFANVSNSLQQLTSFFPAMLEVGKKDLLFAAAKGWYKPREMANSIAAMSPYMKQRIDNEVHAMAEEIDQILLNPTKFEKAQDWAVAHSYFLQTAVDTVMSPIIWQAKFNEATARGATKQEAIDLADSAVRKSQGSNRAIDIAAMEKGSPFYRMFMQFAGFFNSQINLIGEKLARERLLPKTPAKYGRIAMILAQGWWAPAITSMAIALAMRGGPDDEDGDGLWDDWLTELLLGTVRYATAAVPVFGQAINATVNAFNDKPYDDRMSLSPAVSMLDASIRGGQAAVKSLEDPTKAGRAVRDLGSFLSLFGVPVTPVTKAVGYATDVATGKVSPTSEADYARGIITGVASPESKQ